MISHRYLPAVFVISLVIGSLAAFARQESTEKPNKIGFIQMGRITKVDQKNRTITIRSVGASADQSREIPEQNPGFGRESGFGRGGLGGRNPGQRGLANGIETKVLTTDSTVIKNDAGDVVTLNALHVDDFVRVNGVTRDKDFEAREIQINAAPPGGRRESRQYQ